MRFRLTYEGELRATQGEPRDGQKNKLAGHKHAIRRHFHRQLRQLWAQNRFLREHLVFKSSDFRYDQIPDGLARLDGSPEDKILYRIHVASLYNKFGYHFVPLVRKDVSLLCSLDVLFLRRDSPGSAIQAGDIDNRIKTLIDCLRMPQNAAELVGNPTPHDDEKPFYCLMEDDNLIRSFSVETDTLLDEPNLKDDADQRRARVIVTVDVRPNDVTQFNLSFAS